MDVQLCNANIEGRFIFVSQKFTSPKRLLFKFEFVKFNPNGGNNIKTAPTKVVKPEDFSKEWTALTDAGWKPCG